MYLYNQNMIFHLIIIYLVILDLFLQQIEQERKLFARFLENGKTLFLIPHCQHASQLR